MKPIIAVDMDDVLVNENAAMRQFINSTYGAQHTPEDYEVIAPWETFWDTVWEVDAVESAKRYEAYLDAKIGERIIFEPVEGAVEAIAELRPRFDFVIITSRKISTKDVTTTWLSCHFPDIFSGVYFVDSGDGSPSQTKAQICQQINARYLIDDNAVNCIQASQANIIALLFGEYGWNRGEEVPASVTKVSTWQEVLRYFNEQSRQRL